MDIGVGQLLAEMLERLINISLENISATLSAGSIMVQLSLAILVLPI
jgi:hypothetical protein